MAKRERLVGVKDWSQRNRNMIVYVAVLVALFSGAIGMLMLPEVVSINPDVEALIARPREVMVGMHLAIIGLFTLLFWRRPREIAYLSGMFFGELLMVLMLYANLGTP